MAEPIDPRLADKLDAFVVPALPDDFADRMVARALAQPISEGGAPRSPKPGARRPRRRSWAKAVTIGTGLLAAGMISVSAAAMGYLGEPIRQAVHHAIHRVPAVDHVLHRILPHRHDRHAGPEIRRSQAVAGAKHEREDGARTAEMVPPFAVPGPFPRRGLMRAFPLENAPLLRMRIPVGPGPFYRGQGPALAHGVRDASPYGPRVLRREAILEHRHSVRYPPPAAELGNPARNADTASPGAEANQETANRGPFAQERAERRQERQQWLFQHPQERQQWLAQHPGWNRWWIQHGAKAPRAEMSGERARQHQPVADEKPVIGARLGRQDQKADIAARGHGARIGVRGEHQAHRQWHGPIVRRRRRG
ncbi:hypothetical protein KRR38_08625 [Novosphingobium sp. G106]|uniref:hypothetical protein n=1 Tax=Novosphingobium sp. G106 TaxID=2849500 RepID=UPI001C2CFB90|nr:hypothetical protein [Novosphingobium sp. G106]MBV1687736.1 hypothetical protein [Novosphingobium sp. G106]